MFAITKAAYQFTKTQRSLVKNLAKNKITIPENKLTNEIKDIVNLTKATGDYSKNPLKRAFIWVKTFIASFKKIKQDIKSSIANKTEELAAGISKKSLMKETREMYAKIHSVMAKRINEVFEPFKVAKEGAKVAEQGAKAAEQGAKVAE